MGSRTMPYVCEHGRALDWGDFGPDPDNGSIGAERCFECEGPCAETCERCRWEPWRDCGIAEHEHCPTCGHCMGRHWMGDALEIGGVLP